MFQLQNIDKAFRDRGEVIHVARNLSWKLPSGATTALMGESGAGKTTIMNIIAGLDSVDKGSVTVNGINLSAVSNRELSDRASLCSFYITGRSLQCDHRNIQNQS